MAAGAKTAKPRRSSFASVVCKVALSVLESLIVRSGMAMSNRRIATAPPMGRLMKKPGGGQR